MNYQEKLKAFNPKHNYFIGIDSDGCVFDTMEIKQKQFFIPNALKYFELTGFEEVVRETWEFVNLYSVHRGGNRFISLIRVFDYLRERKEILEAAINIPSLESLKDWVKKETKLSNTTLREHIESHGDDELELVLQWSEKINSDIESGLNRIPPFPHAHEALKDLAPLADIVIVSQTPLEALEREWEENNIRQYARLIAAQEHGTKAEHIKYAAVGKYPDANIIMIGDAKGDQAAARENNILFYPVIPGKEDLSWQRFLKEGKNRFFMRTYSGEYENKLHSEFELSLPSRPFWQ
ncbi:MAG TPA: HAD hydrolase-like protein [Bacteroidales bacterium]|nr:HAD hydrolase-like protein [Bacteroidales bacterium]